LAALAWNVSGRSELELYDVRASKSLPAVKLPAEGVGAARFSRDGKHLVITSFESAQPSDVWMAEVGQPFRQLTFAQSTLAWI